MKKMASEAVHIQTMECADSDSIESVNKIYNIQLKSIALLCALSGIVSSKWYINEI